MAKAFAACLGTDVDAGPRHAVVRCDFSPRRRHIFRGLDWRRHAEQARSSGITWSTTRNLLPAVLDYVLAWRAAGGIGGSRGLARASGTGGALSARLADAILDRIRTGVDQVAALCAAAVSGDRDPVGLGAGAPRAVHIVAHEGRGM